MPTNPVLSKKVNSDELDLGKIATALAAKWYYFLIALVLFVSLAVFYLSVACYILAHFYLSLACYLLLYCMFY